MLYFTCSMISSVDLAHYGVSRAKDCGTGHYNDLFEKQKSGKRVKKKK